MHFLLRIEGAVLPQVVVLTDPSVVQQQQVTLKAYTQLQTPIPLNGGLNITLPPEMSFSTSVLNCTVNIPANIRATCTQTQTNQVMIKFSSAVSTGPLQIQINQALNNPTSTTPTSSFQFVSYSSAGLILDQLTTGINLVATVGSFISTTLTTDSQQVGVTTNLNVKFTANHRIPFNGQIIMTFPKWNPQAPNPSDQLDYLQGVISCSSLNTNVLQASLQCSFSSGVLTVSNLAARDIPGGTEVSFSIAGFRNPLSTALVTGFSFTTQDRSGGNIDTTATSGASLKISQPATINIAAFSVDPSVDQSIAGIVGETNIMQVSFISPVPLNQGCQITITFPSQFNLNSIRKITIVPGLLGVQQDIQFTQNGQSITFTSCSSYTTNQLQGILKVDSLVLPGYTKTTSNLNIQIMDVNGNFIAATQTGPTFTPIEGTGLQVTMSANPNIILSSTDLTITVTPQRTVGIVGQFILQFPPQYQLSTGVCANYQSQSSGVSGSATCQFAGNTLTLTNFISQTVLKGSGTALTFTVGRVILPSTQGDRTFLAWIKQQDPTDKQFYNIEQFNNIISVTMNFGSLSAVVTPGTFTAYDNTNYTFQITPNHRMEINGYIIINYPSQISIPDPSFSQSQCRGFVNFPTTPSCVIDTTKQTITLNNGFRIPGSVNGQTYTFNMPGIVNPLTLATTGTFQFYTKAPDGSTMDQLLSGLTLKMTQVPFIKSVIINPGSLVNAAITSYTFLITPTVPVLNQYGIIFTAPSQISLPTNQNSYACSSDDIALISSVSCTTYSSTPNSVLAVLTLKNPSVGISALQTFKVTINGMMNPISTKQTDSFNLIMTDNQLNVLSTLNMVANPVTIMTNTPFTISKASFSANTTGAGQNAAYTIQIFPQHNIQAGGGVMIIYPSQIGVTSISAQVISAVSSGPQTVNIVPSARRISVINAFTNNYSPDTIGVTIQLQGFVNPLFNTEQANSFIVMTFNVDSTNNNYFIDQVTNGLLLNAPCDYPCSTCLPNQPSLCTSCYQTSVLNKLQGQTCVQTCSTGKFFNSTNFSCDNCTSTCLACVNNATYCTQCGVTGFLYLLNNQCLNDCPDGYVKDSTKNKCNRCVNNCKTCQNTETTCTSCDTNSQFPYIYQQNCLNSCPPSISVPIANYQCGNCDPSCRTCSILQTNCTSCLSNMRYDPVLGTCTSVCKEGVQIFNQSLGQCQFCDPNCLTCAGNVTTCTTCRNGLVLTTENTCSQTCSSLNQIPIKGVCKKCELPCSQCVNTTSTCTKCQGDYLLYNLTCLQYCPTKYKANNATGQCVYEGLVCPELFHVNDAGDGCVPDQFECPSGYMINQQRTACVPAPGSIVPFPFFFLSGCLAIVVLGSYIKDKFFTKVYTCLIALIGMQEMIIYGLIVCYSGYLKLWIPLLLSGFSVIMIVAQNIAFFLLYKKDIMHDPTFQKFLRMHPKSEHYITIIALFINFKAIKLFYSGFYGLESCLAQFDDPLRNFFRPMRMVTYFSFIFTYLPIMVADVLIVIQVTWGYQILILAIESFVLAIIITILTLLEFRHPDRLLMSGDEQYIRIKPKSFDGGSVMGALVDVDESTLIRSKVVDDEYEIQLRKRALVQILGHVGKNFLEAQNKGVHLGQDLDKCMTKFDEDQIKLRRAFSLEAIKEEDSWVASGQNETDDEQDEEVLEDREEYLRQRRYSYPLSPKSRDQVPDPSFKAQLREIQAANREFLLQDNVYAECKPQDKTRDEKRKKTVSRRTQTYLRELLAMDGDGALQESDLEVVLDEDAEIDKSFAKGLIEGVIDGLSDMETSSAGQIKITKKKKKEKPKKPQPPGVPEFELQDIMGEFEIDDLGNFIILRGERGELLDKLERRVNRRGYLVDRFGNVINKDGQIIFKAIELDSDDEIPAPFGFEKRKKNLLSLGDDDEFRILEGIEKQVPDDEDIIDKELKAMKKSARRKKKQQFGEDGQILEGDEGDEESSVDSLMAESPTKYGKKKAEATDQNKAENATTTAELTKAQIDENELINKVTQKIIPKKRPPVVSKPQTAVQPPKVKKILSPRSNQPGQQNESQSKQLRPKSVSNQGPPRRIKREDTKELFPSLTIESLEQKKLFKIAESIGGMANQIAAEAQQRLIEEEDPLLQQEEENVKGTQSAIIIRNSGVKKSQKQRIISQIDPDKLEQMKQDHFKDIISENSFMRQSFQNNKNSMYQQQSDYRFPSKAPLDKIYGNLNDVVALEERLMIDQMKGQRPYSPNSSQVTQRRGGKKPETEMRRMTGLEAIYLQKFDKKQPSGLRKGNHQKAKFRTTLQQFVDDPELLVDDGQDYQRQNEMSMMVSNKLDRLQKQYVMSNSSSRLSSIPITSMGFSQVPGGSLIAQGHIGDARRMGGSATGLNTVNANNDSIQPLMKGNWLREGTREEEF